MWNREPRGKENKKLLKTLLFKALSVKHCVLNFQLRFYKFVGATGIDYLRAWWADRVVNLLKTIILFLGLCKSVVVEQHGVKAGSPGSRHGWDQRGAWQGQAGPLPALALLLPHCSVPRSLGCTVLELPLNASSPAPARRGKGCRAWSCSPGLLFSKVAGGEWSLLDF